MWRAERVVKGDGDGVGGEEGRDKQWLWTYCGRKQDMSTTVGKSGETGPMNTMKF